MGTPELAAHILERLLESASGALTTRPATESRTEAGSLAEPPERSQTQTSAQTPRRAADLAGEGAQARFEVVAVITGLDRPRGRGLATQPSAVGQIAARRGVTVYKPASVREPGFIDLLRSLAPDLLVVAAYGRILPREVLSAPRLMPLNVHASLLPKHRGASPVEAAILAGDHETGVSIMRMTERMDAGPVLLQRAIPITPDDTQTSLKARLAELGASALLETLEKIARGVASEAAQDETQATYCRPIKKEDAWINWHADAVYIERMARAYDPWPIARTKFAGEPLLIFRAESISDAASDQPPGTIVQVKPAPLVSCGKGLLKLVEVQAVGRKRLRASDFIHGKRVAPGARLGV